MRIEDEVRRGLKRAAEDARFDVDRWQPLLAHRPAAPRVPKVRRLLVAAVVGAVLVAAVVVPLALLSPLVGGDPGRAPAAGDPTSAESGYERQADGNDGLRITIPEAWTFHQDPSGPDEPRTIFAVGTWSFTRGGDCAPTTAHAELPADGAFLWLIEYRGSGDPQDFPPRPQSFRLDDATHAQYECSLVPSYLLRFEEHGRLFQVHVTLGPQASDSVRDEVLRALDSIEVTAPVPDECPAGIGPWSDPACPLPAWTEAVVEEAGYEVTGDTGSALVAEALGDEFDVWAIPKDVSAQQLLDEGYREAMLVDDVMVYSDGVRMVWFVQGLAVWVAGWEVGEPPPGEPPPTLIVADLVDASENVDFDSIDTR